MKMSKPMRQRRAVLGALVVAPLVIGPRWANAKCAGISGKGEVNLIGNAFPAVQHIAKQVEGCNRAGLKVAFKVTAQAREEVERAFAVDGKSAFDAAVGRWPCMPTCTASASCSR